MGQRYILIIASLLGVSLALFFLLFTVAKRFWQAKKKMFIYILLTLLAFSLISLLSWGDMIANPSVLLFVLQFCFLVMGILHVWALYGYMNWGETDSIWTPILFSVIVWVIGLIPFYLFYMLVSGADGFQFYMLGSSLFFIIPFFFVKTFVAALNMPLPDIEKWYYPVHLEIPDPQAHELENPFVITFILPKKAEDADTTTFRAKAPENMNFGGLFYFFVEDFNEQRMDDPLEFTDKFSRPYGWVFYHKPKWYMLFRKQYINPAKTVKENEIEENSVIVCERTSVLEEGEEDDDKIRALEGKVSSH